MNGVTTLSEPLVLSCEDISVNFGGFQALSDVTLSVHQGQTLALIGPNGAGKTTLMNVLSGLLQPSGGTVHLLGNNVTSRSPSDLANLGVARSFQLINIFPLMTVAENIRVAAQRHCFGIAPFWKAVGGYQPLAQETARVLEYVQLTDVRDRSAGQLSHGQQRALELGMTLVGNPKVLLLDEPLAGVGHNELPAFIDLLRDICANRSVLLIEHNMDVVMELASTIMVLVGGRVLTKGSPDEVRADSRVRTAYLGTEDES